MSACEALQVLHYVPINTSIDGVPWCVLCILCVCVCVYSAALRTWTGPRGSVLHTRKLDPNLSLPVVDSRGRYFGHGEIGRLRMIAHAQEVGICNECVLSQKVFSLQIECVPCARGVHVFLMCA